MPILSMRVSRVKAFGRHTFRIASPLAGVLAFVKAPERDARKRGGAHHPDARHERMDPDDDMRRFAPASRVTSQAFRTTEGLSGGMTCGTWHSWSSHSRGLTQSRHQVRSVR